MVGKYAKFYCCQIQTLQFQEGAYNTHEYKEISKHLFACHLLVKMRKKFVLTNDGIVHFSTSQSQVSCQISKDTKICYFFP